MIRSPRCRTALLSTHNASKLGRSMRYLSDDVGITERHTRNRAQQYTQLLERKTTVFSGIQPTGIPHLGNYLGALRQWKEFQDKKLSLSDPDDLVLSFCVVDLHALTHMQDPKELLKHRNETFASLMAIGLDPWKTCIYFQSSLSGHSRLMWYLSNVASTGYLSRMTQWKSKLGVSEAATIEDQAAREKLKLGLFSYPVLQAADILLWQANIVPVGEDQEQHVEFARNLARGFNSLYKQYNDGVDFFQIPKALISPARRVMSLKDPSVKMSKSHKDPNSRILITDSSDDIRGKIKGALTDSIEGISYDPKQRPGVSNLVEILKHVSHDSSSCEEVASDNATLSMRAFKEHVAGEIIRCFAGFRDCYLELMDSNTHKLDDAMRAGFSFTDSVPNHTLSSVERLIGLRPPKGDHPRARQASGNSKKQKIVDEQKKEENENEQEPDVTPQIQEGVDRPIAS